MTGSKRFLDNPINWSFPVGSLLGIRIRLHVLFVLGAVILLAHSASQAGGGSWLMAVVEGLGSVVILFLIVLLHEFGHCFGARYVGGSAHEILMWPLGGLATVSTPHTARANLITAIAGPLVNVVICALIAIALIVMTRSGWAVPWNPFRFGQTGVPIASTTHRWLVIIFGISYLILLFTWLRSSPWTAVGSSNACSGRLRAFIRLP